MKRLLMISLLIAGVSLSACSVKTIPVQAVLYCPPGLVFPITHKLTDEQSDFLFDNQNDIYQVFANREDLMQARIATLCGIIETTHD